MCVPGPVLVAYPIYQPSHLSTINDACMELCGPHMHARMHVRAHADNADFPQAHSLTEWPLFHCFTTCMASTFKSDKGRLYNMAQCCTRFQSTQQRMILPREFNNPCCRSTLHSQPSKGVSQPYFFLSHCSKSSITASVLRSFFRCFFVPWTPELCIFRLF